MNRLGILCLRYGSAAAFVLLALTANRAVAALDHFASALFLAAVAVTAYACGLGPGLLATALSALALDYYYLLEYQTLDLNHATWVWLTVFVAVALLINVLQESQRRLAALLRYRNERQGQFMSVLAHELRNFLSPITIGLATLRLRGKHDDSTLQCCDVMERQIGKLTRLIDDLLDVARIQQGKVHLQKTEVDLHQVISQACEGVKPLVQARRHTFEVSLPPSPLPVDGDATRLEQVFLNLLTNAAKYTEPGGCIGLHAERAGAEWLIRVRDNGKGMPPELLPHVFDLFLQGEPGAQGGLGIGLNMVRGLVELHGGSVSAFSEGPGQGSEFAVRLPAALRLPAAAPVAIHGNGP
ncbi:MAG: DUF4118 domain-containing protein [Planctomycetia bacterium]|nr:DUF4118 domain-containing protein [Planctomycetia bacterium]